MNAEKPAFDTRSHESFFEYYKQQSLSPATAQRFAAIAEVALRTYGPLAPGHSLDVLDVGCGAGAQLPLWSSQGHRYAGVDINEPLVTLARQRAADAGVTARFEVASATELPFADGSFDICLMPELLEHIADWQGCLREAMRVLRPGGVIFLSTNNRLCPKQREFNLPAYSWYPGFVKRYFERRAVTDWPAVANYATYPAVNWFSFYQLRRYFARRGLDTLDRFDIMRLDDKSAAARAVVQLARALPPLRFVGHVLTSSTVVVARRPRETAIASAGDSGR